MLTTEQVSSIERLLRAGLTGRQVARKLGHSRGTVRAIVHGRHCRQHAAEKELGGSEAHHYRVGLLRRCGKCGSLLTAVPCRACRLRLHRRRLFQLVESPEPLESRLGPAEAARLLDTLTIEKKIRLDPPRPRFHRSPNFLFHFGRTGHVFCLRLHPPINVVESPEPRVQSKGGAS
jgi:hypothetical protein